MKLKSAFDYGRVLNRVQIVFAWAGLIVPILMVCATIGVCIVASLDLMSVDRNMIVTLIVLNLLCCGFGASMVYVLAYNRRLKKMIAVWLQDAVAVRAVVRVDNSEGLYTVPQQISVAFGIDGKNYCIASKTNVFTKHRNSDFLNYINLTVPVLYSLKYNVVMIARNPESL